MPRIVVDYYVGAYGHTVRIDTQTFDDLLQIREVFRSLAEGKVSSLDLARTIVSLQVLNMEKIILHLVTGGCASASRTLEFVRSENEGHKGPVIHWSLPSDEWDDCICFVDELLEDNEPGHQYLNLSHNDDALIELAFKEYRPPSI